MTLRRQRTLAFKPQGVTDTVDGTNGAPGSLRAAVNLVPSMHTKNVWVPRPALRKAFDLPQSGQGEALIEIGAQVWGMIQSSTFPGKSEPFGYNLDTGSPTPIRELDISNLPDSTANDGDWIPPVIAQVGAYLVFTHPGFQMPNAFGWLDMTGFADSATGTTTSGSPTITALSKDTLLAGWRPGMTLTGPGIPTGVRISSVSTDGLSVTLSQPATATATAIVLSAAGGTPQSPLWAAGNLNTYPLPGVARVVAMFNGRAEYAVKNSTVFSDAGDPLQRTNADQVLTIQNGLDITAMTTQPFANQTVIGGVVQALLLFQGAAAIWQVTGDPATQNLALNFVAQIGTDAPLSIVSVPPALRFIAPDGMRQINLDGTVSPPMGANGEGVAEPFINAPFQSRICAAYNEDVYRASVTGYVSVGGAVTPELAAGEYWYHEKLQAWSGPHSDPARLITATNRPATEHGFLTFRLQNRLVLGSGAGWVLATGIGVMLGQGIAANATNGVWFSNTRQLVDATFQENGVPLDWVLQTSLLPDSGDMFENAILETAVALALAPTGTALIAALDERGVQLDTVAVAGFAPDEDGTQLPPTFDTSGPFGDRWNEMFWNQGFWGPSAVAGSRVAGAILAQRAVEWHTTLVFKQASLVVSGLADANTQIGNLYLRYQRSGYMLIDPARLSVGLPGIPNFAAA
jgi:hypothetical protein